MATLRCLLPKVRLAHLVKGILLCAFLLLALFFCYNNNSFQPTKPLIAITNVPSDVSKDNQSKVSATFDLVRYGLAQMTFDNASVDRNETGGFAGIYFKFLIPTSIILQATRSLSSRTLCTTFNWTIHSSNSSRSSPFSRLFAITSRGCF